MVTIINPGTTPVVYSAEGHSLGAGERRDGVELDTVGRRAVETERLVIPDEGQDAETERDASAEQGEDEPGSARRTQKRAPQVP